ncbi:leucine-rich repeat domain-containing protein [Canibacter sp. lx-45]|uniref:leucine-rich repeat domain-containing protein n=1 Tax=Canibacter zhuwentaonis TaxID=2837491 RepID=UPI001BDD4CD1|nr:leucine-rich repeat domain-containing protein [Canibacter zhuwentaonis]MBT1035502.1 leucine-rich repeat domain-containing protein [Canibacter zhuwentaonis]
MSGSRVALSATTALIIGLTGVMTSPSALAVSGVAGVMPAVDPDSSEAVALEQGTANWNFRDSFRDYVGTSNETRTEPLKTVPETREDLAWQLAPGQTFDSQTPEPLKFLGKVNWEKYDGILNVDIANPTIDFQRKQLLVDAKTAGTLSGKPAAAWQQRALLNLPDLQWEVKEGVFKAWSHSPVFTSMSSDLVGFYEGEKGAPLVATAKVTGTDATAPAPVLWELFPEKYVNPFEKDKLIDPDEVTESVEVPDTSLRACILWELDLNEKTPIVNKVLQQVQSMNCINGNGNGKVKDLTGLEHAKNLVSLRVNNNELTDLSPLKGATKLQSLDVSDNKLTNLDIAKHLPALTSISAENNRISDISGLKGHTERIEKLQLDNNKLTHLNDLPEDLIQFSAESNRISDITGIAKSPYLRVINLRHNRITDVNPLKNLRVVTKVDLRNNFITDPAPLDERWSSRFIPLEYVRLNYNKFSDWAPVADVKGIDKPRDNSAPAQNPKTLEELALADEKLDALHAEQDNPVITADLTSTAPAGEAQKSTDAGGAVDAAPTALFSNIPEGSKLLLENAAADGSVTVPDRGVFTIDSDGVVTFNPSGIAVGSASVTVALHTPAGNIHKATYTAVATQRPAPTIKVADLTADGKLTAQQLSFVASGFLPAEKVKVTVDGAEIASVQSDTAGVAKLDGWPIPVSFAGAEHLLSLSANSGSGSVKFSVPARVHAVPETAPTRPDLPILTVPPNTTPSADTGADATLGAISGIAPADAAKQKEAKADVKKQLANTGGFEIANITTALLGALALVSAGIVIMFDRRRGTKQ